VVIERGGIYWADLGLPDGSRPAKRRPVLVIQAHSFNESKLATVLAAVITSNTALATMPGNVFLPSFLPSFLQRSLACRATRS
jgi:mRNA interferase MazF